MNPWPEKFRKRGRLSFDLFEDLDFALCCVPLDPAWLESEEGVVVAHPDVRSRVETGAALANQDCACENCLPVIALNAETFAVAVAPVLTGSLSFFMCHCSKILG